MFLVIRSIEMNFRTCAVAIILLGVLLPGVETGEGKQRLGAANGSGVSSLGAMTKQPRVRQKRDPCPNALTQREIDRCAGEQFKKADSELNRVYNRISGTISSSDRANLVDAQRAWLSYRDSNCKAERQLHGGSIAPTVEAFCLQDLTEARSKELIRIYETPDER
jgi:uncharacterized protein YecT (DUF1311 family)